MLVCLHAFLSLLYTQMASLISTEAILQRILDSVFLLYPITHIDHCV